MTETNETAGPSLVVQENIASLIERERAGRIEHGGDLDRQDLPVMRWLEELRCESLDSANYATKLMHLLPKLLAAVAVLERIGFSWADGEWKSAAAQEAVAWQRRYKNHNEWFDISEVIYEATKCSSFADRYEVRELYAAPVAAAPGIDMGVPGATLTIDGETFTVDEVRAALIDASPKGGSDDFGAMTDLLSRWRHNAAIEPSPNPMAKARREVWVQCLGELESAMQATSAEVGS